MEQDKIEEMCNTSLESIVAGMNKVHPESKFSHGTDYKQIATEYFDLCVMELLNNLTDNDIIPEVSLKSIKSKFNYRYNKTQYWWNYLFTNYPLWTERSKGYWVSKTVKQLTQIDCLYPVSALMHYRLQSDFGDYFRSSIRSDNRVYTELDVDNLIRYRDTNIREYTSGSGLTKKLKQSKLDQINRSQNIIDQQQSGVLISNAEQKHNVIGHSRVYYTGANNLQGMKKVVREAALGECYKYDINSSVYAYMYNVIKTHDSDIRLPYMIDIIQRKDYWRNQLASECILDSQGNTGAGAEFTSGWIKKSLNALTFGSDPNNFKSGIASYIKNPADRARFANHPVVKGLKTEIKLYRDIIRQQFPRSQYPGVTIFTLCNNHYQHTEAQAMRQIITQCDIDVLLLVHDCIYTKRRIDQIYATVVLQDVLGPYAKFDRELIPVWQDRSRWAQNAQAILQHKERIYAEELLARR